MANKRYKPRSEYIRKNANRQQYTLSIIYIAAAFFCFYQVYNCVTWGMASQDTVYYIMAAAFAAGGIFIASRAFRDIRAALAKNKEMKDKVQTEVETHEAERKKKDGLAARAHMTENASDGDSQGPE